MRLVITGSSGYIGTQLCRRFQNVPAVEEIIGVDIAPSRESFGKFTFYQKDCTTDLTEIFENRDIDTVIHLVFVLNPIHDSHQMYRINVGSLDNVLQFAKDSNVRRIVVTSSATAYGAHPDNPDWIREEEPLRGNRDYQYAYDKTIVEEHLREFGEDNPHIEIVIARMAIVCGSHISNFISRYIGKAVVPLPGDCDTQMQFLHENDAAEGLFRLTMEAPAGVYNLGPPNTVHPKEAVQFLGNRVVEVRPGLLRILTSLAWTLRIRPLTEAPASMIDFIQYRWVVDGSKVEQETSFTYQYSSEDALRDFASTVEGV